MHRYISLAHSHMDQFVDVLFLILANIDCWKEIPDSFELYGFDTEMCFSLGLLLDGYISL